jgi:hypothetical protein
MCLGHGTRITHVLALQSPSYPYCCVSSRLLKNALDCHSERSEESAFSKFAGKQQIPRRLRLLGMTPFRAFQHPARWIRLRISNSQTPAKAVS